MKWLLAITTTALLASCSTGTAEASALASKVDTASVETQVAVKPSTSVFGLIQAWKSNTATPTTLIGQQLANYQRLQSAIKALKATANRTWYVFSGDTPAGWDCSGLVRWFYEQLGITLEHSATAQGHLGTKVRTPKVGDIVVYGYKNSYYYYHSAIYLGNGMIIQAPSKGLRTAITPIGEPAFAGSTISFRRIATP